jgi:multisubunit Na+/H+ antiporter MnhC subunit
MSYDHGLFEPPPGETINYVDPPTIAPSLVAVVITALVIVIVTFALRMWCRIKIVQQFGWDDGKSPRLG